MQASRTNDLLVILVEHFSRDPLLPKCTLYSFSNERHLFLVHLSRLTHQKALSATQHSPIHSSIHRFDKRKYGSVQSRPQRSAFRSREQERRKRERPFSSKENFRVTHRKPQQEWPSKREKWSWSLFNFSSLVKGYQIFTATVSTKYGLFSKVASMQNLYMRIVKLSTICNPLITIVVYYSIPLDVLKTPDLKRNEYRTYLKRIIIKKAKLIVLFIPKTGISIVEFHLLGWHIRESIIITTLIRND